VKNKKIIFIALDCSVAKAKFIVKSIPKKKYKKYTFALKIGYQIFFSENGRKFIKSIKNFPIFLDLKLYDIENTTINALRSLKDIKNIDYITIHISSGLQTIKAAKKLTTAKLLGVTTLTSFDQKKVREIGYTKKIEELIIHQAKLAKKAGCYAVICSGKESLRINELVKIKTVTPGIRLPGDKTNDQKRVVTPKNALTNQKATGIVIGRSISSGNIKNNFKKLFQNLDT
tara:strand:+ start:9609 stop:10298 length:690 start_codon:yes stop_codon:yes gene_type:complete